jgi:hypothetical protein
MEAVSSFKYSEVFKKMNFIFAAVGSGGFGGGGIEEEVNFRSDYVLIFSLAYIQGSSYVRNFLFSFRLKFVATYFLQTCVIIRSHSKICTELSTHLMNQCNPFLLTA